MNEPGWVVFSQDTRESPTLCDKCPATFYDLSQSGPQFYVSSEGLELTVLMYSKMVPTLGGVSIRLRHW